MTQSSDIFLDLLSEIKQKLEQEIAKKLQNAPDDLQNLQAAMRYGMLGGGKRLRAFLLYGAARLAIGHHQKTGNSDSCQCMDTNIFHAMVALEMVHGYSLIHDDLPAMDDDKYRHGKLCLHLEFDEATAILTGDALLTYAFELLSDGACHPDPTVRVKLVNILAKQAGFLGMAGGQNLDMQSVDFDKDKLTRQDYLTQIKRLQSLKTGALFVAATQMGGVMAGADDDLLYALKIYAEKLGLGFQIYDDLLDVIGDSEKMGKATGKDKVQGKLSFLQVLSPAEAKKYAENLASEAIQALAPFAECDKKTYQALEGLARFVVEREA